MVIGPLDCDSPMAVISHPNLFCSGEKGVLGPGEVFGLRFSQGGQHIPTHKNPKQRFISSFFYFIEVSYRFNYGY